MIDGFVFKDVYGIDDLLQIMRCLRSEGGCPWDREQTHESIKKNLIEETYEVIEAINKQDRDLLCEELGDVLMQVVFHAQMEAEAGSFTFENVADGVCKKLIERHPHVFGEVQVDSSDEVLRNWEDIKKRSKGQKSQTETMLSVPRELPALMRATKVQKKAAKIGFDWPEVSGAVDKLYEETAELRSKAAARRKLPRNWATCSSAQSMCPASCAAMQRKRLQQLRISLCAALRAWRQQRGSAASGWRKCHSAKWTACGTRQNMICYPNEINCYFMDQ